MQRILPIAALFCSVTALLLTLWILVPALLPVLWLVAVVASEWSLYLGVLALAGVVLGLAARRKTWRRAGGIAVGCGLLALVLAVYPPLATRPLAAAHGVDLSLARYIAAPRPAQPVVQTWTYAHVDGQTLDLDAYLPDAPPAGTARPAVVVVHGGSWNGGRRSDFPAWNAWLVAEGYAVFDIDYRLAPQPNWHTATEDVLAAVRWIKARADTFGVDPERMALLGRSAGGHLALLAAYTAPAPDARVQAVVAFYAPTDLRWGYRHPANPLVIDGPATLRRFTGGTPESKPDVYTRASPIQHVQPPAPATLLLHGLKDQLVRPENARRLLAALPASSRVPPRHQALFIPYAQHGFDYHFNGWGSQVAQVVLRRHLRAYLNAVQQADME